ncbi:MAG: S26 family signal peptidase [Bradyrhizobium sp.]|uniref:S26 family signal peptidase n=1 Tax=Bradyrhizobium sp. TaxID=376 RepID=UPI0029B48F6C|nr:S26 family signal peptidase [Bradyrhizobium sp.]MDX3966814.1 S26 family signal peptidase [Bradyrhizobium sp.]
MILIRTNRRRRGRRRPRAVLALSLLGLGLIGLAALDRPVPWLVWNASPSAPIGLYRVLLGKPVRGDLVLAHTPESVRKLAAERGYLPLNVPLVKRVAAAGGDIVCAIDDAISINDRVVAERLTRDRLGRPLPSWSGCHLLDGGEAFLLMEGRADSFDSRYFGPVPTATIIGRLAPLWVE